MELKAWSKRLDSIANVVVIGTCLLVCSLLVMRAAQARNEQRVGLSALAPVFPVGFKPAQPAGIEYAASDFTVLVGLSSRCKYCAESMPMLRTLAHEAGAQKKMRVRLVALALEPLTSLTSYLQRNGLAEFLPNEIRVGSDLAPVAQRTPSIVLVDRSGSVVATWPGLVTEERLNDVLEHLTQASALTPQQK